MPGPQKKTQPTAQGVPKKSQARPATQAQPVKAKTACRHAEKKVGFNSQMNATVVVPRYLDKPEGEKIPRKDKHPNGLSKKSH